MTAPTSRALQVAANLGIAITSAVPSALVLAFLTRAHVPGIEDSSLISDAAFNLFVMAPFFAVAGVLATVSVWFIRVPNFVARPLAFGLGFAIVSTGVPIWSSPAAQARVVVSIAFGLLLLSAWIRIPPMPESRLVAR